jgi:hypothetical protein
MTSTSMSHTQERVAVGKFDLTAIVSPLRSDPARNVLMGQYVRRNRYCG